MWGQWKWCEKEGETFAHKHVSKDPGHLLPLGVTQQLLKTFDFHGDVILGFRGGISFAWAILNDNQLVSLLFHLQPFDGDRAQIKLRTRNFRGSWWISGVLGAGESHSLFTISSSAPASTSGTGSGCESSSHSASESTSSKSMVSGESGSSGTAAARLLEASWKWAQDFESQVLNKAYQEEESAQNHSQRIQFVQSMSNEYWETTTWPSPMNGKISITSNKRLATRVGPTSPLGPTHRQGPWVFWTHGCGKAGHDWVSSWWAPWSLLLAWPASSTLWVQDVEWSSARKVSWSLSYFKSQVLVMKEAAPFKQKTDEITDGNLIPGKKCFLTKVCFMRSGTFICPIEPSSKRSLIARGFSTSKFRSPQATLQ